MSNLTPRYVPTSYADAAPIVDARPRHMIPLCYATYMQRDDENSIVIIHHNTAIVTFRSDGSIYLNGGGWASRTTADRMRRFTPPGIYVNSRGGSLNVSVNGIAIGNAQYGLAI